MSKSLPYQPSVRQLKIQAKNLLKAHKNGDVSVCETLKLLRRFSNSTSDNILKAAVSLKEVQFAIALSYGFKGWEQLAGYVEAVEMDKETVEAHLNYLYERGLVTHWKNLQGISDKIYGAKNPDEILINIAGEISFLFKAERLTVYVVDGNNRELVSRYKMRNEVREIRVPITANSIVGYAALKRKLINIQNVYDDWELKGVDEKLKFDKSYDQKVGFHTRQMLASPIIFKDYLLGAIQLINRKDGNRFNEIDELSVKELSRMLGVALWNQRQAA